MLHVTSADGTSIAADRLGEGRPVILVGAALQTRSTYDSLAVELAQRFTVLNYDRRGRGESGDTAPYAVDREIEDLAALVTEAGGQAAVYGHSSGAGLTFRAAAAGVPISELILHEPPYGPDDDDARAGAREIAEKINTELASDHRGDALRLFLGGAGMPPEVVDQMVQDPDLVAIASTIAYDLEIMGNIAAGGTVPVREARRVSSRALVINGGESPAFMRDSGRLLAQSMPDATHRIVDGQGHFIEADMLAPVLSDFLTP